MCEKKRALIITTISGFVPQFEMNHVRLLQGMGYEVHYASNFHNPHYGRDNSRLEGTGIVCHQVDFVRSPFRLGKNGRAFRQLRRLFRELSFQLVHCHTPMGGALGRLAAGKYRRDGTRILYTAHGFHFYQGAPLLKWLLYYPVEWLLARSTDVLITINEEDYRRAKRFPLPGGGRVEKINGVGIDVEAFQKGSVNREEKRRELGIGENDCLLVSVGELNRNKNYGLLISILTHMKRKNSGRRWRCLMLGEGSEKEKLKRRIMREGLNQYLRMLGYRTDVWEILAVSDIFIFPSRREGLPVALMEAMYMSLPIICKDIRGNCDLVEDGKGGYLLRGEKVALWAQKLEWLCNISVKNRHKMGEYNRKKICEQFSKKKIEEEMRRIYDECNKTENTSIYKISESFRKSGIQRH